MNTQLKWERKKRNLTTNNTYLADDTAIGHVFPNKPVFARGHDLGKVADSKHDRKVKVCRLSDADRQRYIDRFKSLDIDKCPYEIPRFE